MVKYVEFNIEVNRGFPRKYHWKSFDPIIANDLYQPCAFIIGCHCISSQFQSEPQFNTLYIHNQCDQVDWPVQPLWCHRIIWHLISEHCIPLIPSSLSLFFLSSLFLNDSIVVTIVRVPSNTQTRSRYLNKCTRLDATVGP